MANNNAKAAVRGSQGSQGKNRGAGERIQPVSPAKARLEKRANDEKIIKTIKMIFAIVVIVAVVGTATGMFLFLYKPSVASVGGQGVAQYEFKYFLGEAKMLMVGQLGYSEPLEDDDPFWQSNISGEKAIDVAKKTARDNAQEMKIHLAKAKEQGLSLTAEDNSSVDMMAELLESNSQSQYGMSASEYLYSYYGITLGEYRKIMQSLYLSNRVSSEMLAAMEVTDDQAREYYDSNAADYKEATVRHILFLYEGPEGAEVPRTREESQQLADETLAKINAGEDMTVLANELSEDPGVVDNSGEYAFHSDGLADGGQYEQGFVDWAFEDGREIGDTGIVELTNGFHVMKLEGMAEDAFDDVKETIISSIKEERYQASVDEWKNDPQYAITVNEKVYDSII
jgi:foldase protein PrsA